MRAVEHSPFGVEQDLFALANVERIFKYNDESKGRAGKPTQLPSFAVGKRSAREPECLILTFLQLDPRITESRP